MNDVQTAKAMEEEMLSDLLWLSPYGALVLAAIGAVVLALALPRHRQGLVGAYVAGAHLSAAALAAGVWLDRGFRSTMSGTVVVDGLALAIVGILGVSGAVTVALARPTVAGTDREGEFYAVLAAASFAAAVLSSAGDIALIALSLGLLSLSSFILAGYLRGSLRGNEAALKYYIYGTVAGAAMVYGLSFWFGLAGSTELGAIGRALPDAPVGMVVVSTVLVVVGLGYKASLVPFHFWTPDVYEGAPLPVTAYLSVLPKVAGLVALARVLPQALPDGSLGWPTAIAIVAAVTMTLGNLAALWQSNVVRLLAYSSIAQAGYLLMGVAAMDGSEAGLPALVYYLAAYAATNLAAFAVVLAVQRESGSADVAAFAGLGRRHPWWTAALVLSFLSLLGLPPLAGFVGKLEVFLAAIDAGQAWLAVVAVLNTVVSLFYYLRVIAPAVLSPAAEDTGQPRAATAALATALAVATVATVALGVVAEPLLDLANGARLMGAR
ncbi:MAG: NADH-ubiquinone oxidoreductase chain N [uncultured Solirubrobacteraceae bacterium]|uniref:NADH-quinone oxidoreductase subunit N n=1 Tax=uncultured Solirubrobacteraceae bacterium TaxID=1162706 RepID=A0A6J4RDS5_9ACTN|nr:MAG: NADH-ubiquinone oxidoreductase chain N [uncultured Solirubrobacteraceae bacterium]